MIVVNNTRWNTAHLKAIATRVAQDALEPHERKDTVVEFVPARAGRVTGYAYHGQVYVRRIVKGRAVWYTKIRVPTVTALRRRIETKIREQAAVSGHEIPASQPPVDKIGLAAVIAHEFAHFGGRTNRDLHGSALYGFTRDWRERYAWAEEFPLEEAAPKAKPPIVDREAKRVREYEQKVREWETKVKRATTVLARWRRKQALAQSRLARAASPK